MQPSDAMIVTSGMISAACFRISEQAATNTGAYSTSGSPSAIERSSGLKSVSSELICSCTVTVPSPASKFTAAAAVRPCVYGLSSWIVASFVAPCSFSAYSATIAPWMRSLWAVRA